MSVQGPTNKKLYWCGLSINFKMNFNCKDLVNEKRSSKRENL